MTPTSTSTAEMAGRKTALIIDDDPNGLRVMAGLLAEAGYRAVVACGADDAWRKLARQRFDIALVELAMKQVSGIRLIEMMRANPLMREMPVLAMTTPVRPSLARQIGCDGFVFRPIQAAELLRAMRRVFNAQPGANGAAAEWRGRGQGADGLHPRNGEATSEEARPFPTTRIRSVAMPSRKDAR